MDGELLLHLDVMDAIGECEDDGLVRHLGDGIFVLNDMAVLLISAWHFINDRMVFLL